jgi:hypothetical protein
MIMRCKLGSTAVAAVSLVAFVTVQGQPASAQVSWDWSGGERQVVAFNPKYSPGQIIVSFGDRKLYFITQPGQAISYPIAIPREQSRWQGVTVVSQKRVNPSWTPTPTMLRENPRLPRWVPGGHPMNPLGVRGLYLGSSAYRIHGTDAPWTIGTAVSKGCIRLYNEDVLDLYPRVRVGAKVTVTYDRFTAAALANRPPAPSKRRGRPQPAESSFFDLFGDDEPPAKATRRRSPRPRAKSAAVDRRPAADKNVAAGKSVAAGTGATGAPNAAAE